MPTPNKSLIFKQAPNGYPVPGQDLAIETREIDLDAELAAGSVQFKGLYHSLDPYMRSRMITEGNNTFGAFQLNAPFMGYIVAEILKSNNAKFPVGEIMYGIGPFQEYFVLSEQHLQAAMVIKDAKSSGIPLSQYLGALGMPGQTAYFGLHRIGEPKKGETIFVSAASGAVGAMVGQLAKAAGLRVVGSAGDDEKVKYCLEKAHFDAAFNYKKVNISEELKKACPQGIDIYFENVGGETLDAVLENINAHARIPVCGMISQYNVKDPYGIKNLMSIIYKRVKLQGFIVSDYAKDYAQFYTEVTPLVKEGKIHVQEDVVPFDSAPEAFLGLLQGKNFGKLVVKIAN